MLNRSVAKLNPKSKLTVMVSVTILVGFATYNWIISPQTSYLRAAKLYETTVGEAGKMTTMIKNQMMIKKKEIQQLNSEIAAIQDSFFLPKQASEFFLDLQPLAHQCDCIVDQLTFMPSEQIPYRGSEEGEGKEAASGIILKRSAMSFAGSYKNIISFLRRLGSYSQRIAITDLHIESDDLMDDHLLCQMTINIYLIDDKELETDE